MWLKSDCKKKKALLASLVECPLFIIKAYWQHRFLWFSLTIGPYQPSHLVSPLDSTHSLYKTDECKFLLVGQHWCVHAKESTIECCLWLCQQCQACLARLSWMVREMGDKWPYNFCFVECCFQELLKKHTASSCSFHLAFSRSVSLECKWCNHTEVLARLQFMDCSFQQATKCTCYPTVLVHLSWMVCEMGGKWPYNFCFAEYCFQDLFKTACNIIE